MSKSLRDERRARNTLIVLKAACILLWHASDLTADVSYQRCCFSDSTMACAAPTDRYATSSDRTAIRRRSVCGWIRNRCAYGCLRNCLRSPDCSSRYVGIGGWIGDGVVICSNNGHDLRLVHPQRFDIETFETILDVEPHELSVRALHHIWAFPIFRELSVDKEAHAGSHIRPCCLRNALSKRLAQPRLSHQLQNIGWRFGDGLAALSMTRKINEFNRVMPSTSTCGEIPPGTAVWFMAHRARASFRSSEMAGCAPQMSRKICRSML